MFGNSMCCEGGDVVSDTQSHVAYLEKVDSHHTACRNLHPVVDEHRGLEGHRFSVFL